MNLIKSIKLANSYSTDEVGYIAKDLSNLYNLKLKVEFSVVILKSFFEELIETNTIKNKIQSLLNNIDNESNQTVIRDSSKAIVEAILNCEFSEDLKENINDAYETLPWQKTQSAKDLLNEPKHKIDIIVSPDYVTSPIIISNIEKNLIFEKIKQAYASFFSEKEITYRLNSKIDEEFSISLILQKHEDYNATAFCYPDKNLGILKLYVFPGCININNMISPDNEVRPDYYEIVRDTLKLKRSVAGKQKFKNTCFNGDYKREECNITNFIVDDYAAREIARITKKAGILLEKEVQVIFNISQNNLIINHVSNILDLQKEYYSHTEKLIAQEENTKEEYEEIDSMSEIEEKEIEDIPEPIENNEEQDYSEKINQDLEESQNNIIEKEVEQETSNSPDDILNSDKPLSELMNEQPKQEPEIELEEQEEDIEEQKDENSNEELNEPKIQEQNDSDNEQEPYESEKEKINNDQEDLTEDINDSEKEQEPKESNETEEQEDNDILNSEPIDILNDSEKEQESNDSEKDSEDSEQNIPKQEDEDNTEEVKEQELEKDEDDFKESIDDEDKDNLDETDEQETEQDQEVDLEEPKKDDDFIL